MKPIIEFLATTPSPPWVRLLCIIFLMFSGCSNSRDLRYQCLSRLLNQPFDKANVYSLWPSNQLDIIWQKEVRQHFSASPIYTQSMYRVYEPENQGKWNRERIGNCGVEYYFSNAEILLNEPTKSEPSQILSIELLGKNVSLLEGDVSKKPFELLSLTEAKKLFPAQIWNIKRHLNNNLNISLVNGVLFKMNIGGKQFDVETKFVNERPVSVIVSCSKKKKEPPKNAFVEPPRDQLDLSDFSFPLGWRFNLPSKSLDSPQDLVMLRNSIKNFKFDHMLDLGVLPKWHMRIVYNNSTMPAMQLGMYATLGDAIKIFTSYSLKGREQAKYIYVDLDKIHPACKIILPEHIPMPASIKDCRSSFACYYECHRQDGRATFVACDKIAFLFFDDKLMNVLYYGCSPFGEEFDVMRSCKESERSLFPERESIRGGLYVCPHVTKK